VLRKWRFAATGVLVVVVDGYWWRQAPLRSLKFWWCDGGVVQNSSNSHLQKSELNLTPGPSPHVERGEQQAQGYQLLHHHVSCDRHLKHCSTEVRVWVEQMFEHLFSFCCLNNEVNE
jgi:hypothetical protein